jgi:hypothetical protein
MVVYGICRIVSSLILYILFKSVRKTVFLSKNCSLGFKTRLVLCLHSFCFCIKE